MDKIREAQDTARKLRGMVFVLSQAMQSEHEGSIYCDCLDAMEDMAFRLCKNLTDIYLDSQQKKVQ